MTINTRALRRLILAAGLTAALAACGSTKDQAAEGITPGGTTGEGGRGYILDGDDGAALVSTDGRKASEGGTGIGVNSFLWRASLDTLSFMPLVTADPFGGVIITDWYTAPDTPTERFKVQVYILDKRLRADGVTVNVFRQERGEAADWLDAPVDPNTKIQMENAILTKARQLRVATISN